MDAGLEVFGTTGYAGSTVRGVCAVAGLNQRYFYESFDERADLLLAVYERIMTETATRMVEAVRAADGFEARTRAGLSTWFRAVTEDRRKARVLTIEIVGVSEQIERRRRELRHTFASFIAEQAAELTGLSESPTGFDVAYGTRVLVAGVIDAVVDWIRQDVDLTVDELIDNSVRLFLFTGAAAYPGILPAREP